MQIPVAFRADLLQQLTLQIFSRGNLKNLNMFSQKYFVFIARLKKNILGVINLP